MTPNAAESLRWMLGRLGGRAWYRVGCSAVIHNAPSHNSEAHRLDSGGYVLECWKVDWTAQMGYGK